MSAHQKRPYQDRVVNALVDAGGSGAVRGPTGSGKTVIGLRVVQQVGFNRLLILVKRKTGLLTWKKNLADIGFVGEDDICILESKTKPKRIAAYYNQDYKVVIALYQTAVKDVVDICSEDTGFDYVVCDESHYIKNKKTLAFKEVKKICRGRKKIFLTATPQSKGPQDFWTVLHILSPKVFSSYYEWVTRYCIMDDDGYGSKPVAVKKAHVSELKERVRGFVHNITSKEIDGWVPKRVRKILPVEMSKKITKIYMQLEKELLADLPNGEIVLTPNTLAKSIRLRQLLCCPSILHEALGVGSAFEHVLEHAEENHKHIVIFSEFVSAFEYWEAHLKSLDVPCYKIVGGMSQQDTINNIEKFSRHKDSETLSVMLVSEGCAESFDLVTPQSAYFVGFSWSQIMNYQAEGRLTRGNKTHCNFFYMVHEGTEEQNVMDMLNRNVNTTNITMSDKRV